MQMLHGSNVPKVIVHAQQYGVGRKYENNPPDGFLNTGKTSILLPEVFPPLGGDIFLLPDVVALFS